MAKDDGRYDVVIQPPLRVAAKEAIGQASAGRDGHRREGNAAGDISHRLNPGPVRRLKSVGRDESLGVQVNARARQGELLDIGHTSHRPDDTIERSQAPAVMQFDLQAALRQTHELRTAAALLNLDAHLTKHQQCRLPQERIELFEYFLAANDEGDLRSQASQNAGKLDGDITAAGYGDSFRSLCKLEKAVRGDAKWRTRDARHERPAAGGDDDVRGAQCAPCRRDQLRADEACAALDVLNLAAGEVAREQAVQALHVGVALRLKSRPIVPGGRRPKTVIDRVFQGFMDFRGVPHDLFGDAAYVHAGAAQAAGFDERHARSEIRGALGAGEAAAAAADDQ